MSVDRILSLVKDFSYSKCLSLTVLLQPQLQLQLQLRFFTLHYTTLHHTTLHYTTLDHTTLPYIALHYTRYTTRFATATTLHYLHYTTTTTPLRYSYNYSCATPHYIQQLWVRPTATKHSSNHLSVHRWICSAMCDSQQPTSPMGVLFSKLPPPFCAALLVWYGLVWFGLVCIHSVCVCICTHVSIIYLCTCETSPGTGMISLMLM